jgi:two-component system phosphate regulon sensor histidine kinase PhoR
MRGIPPEVDGVWGEITDTLNRQRRRHSKTVDKMRRTISRITRVTEALDDGVIVLRSDRTLDWWNSSANKLLDLRSRDRGTAIVNLIRDPDFVNYINLEKFIGTIKLKPTDEVETLLQLSASYFGDNEIVLVVSDITRQDSLESLRREFVGNVSHELRTPLTVIRGYLETLQEFSEDQVLQKKAYQQMSEQVVRMQALSDDLILLSRSEEPSQTPVNQNVNLNDLLNSIIIEAKSLSNGTHNLVFTDLQVVNIDTNPSEMRSILDNIIFNAVRHNCEGADILITLSQNNEAIEVSIKDNGIGIDTDEIPRLTERFYRGDPSRNSNTGGSGLGLAIVKHALTRCGGTLTISSRLGKGAEFICRFPL